MQVKVLGTKLYLVHKKFLFFKLFKKVTGSCSLIKSQISKPLLIKQTLLRKMVAPDALIYMRRWPLSRQFKPSGKAEHKPGT